MMSKRIGLFEVRIYQRRIRNQTQIEKCFYGDCHILTVQRFITVIYGGFIRDMYLGLIPNDVDIATNMTLPQILNLFPEAKVRVSSTGHPIIGYKFERGEKWYLEIYPTSEDIFQKSILADYTINALIFDGYHVIDRVGALEDLENKIIREVSRSLLQQDLEKKPQLWMKSLRLQARTGFQFSTTVIELMGEYTKIIKKIELVTLTTEGWSYVIHR